METQAGFADIGDSVTRVENLLKEQKHLEEKGQVCTPFSILALQTWYSRHFATSLCMSV